MKKFDKLFNTITESTKSSKKHVVKEWNDIEMGDYNPQDCINCVKRIMQDNNDKKQIIKQQFEKAIDGCYWDMDCYEALYKLLTNLSFYKNLKIDLSNNQKRQIREYNNFFEHYDNDDFWRFPKSVLESMGLNDLIEKIEEHEEM